MSPTNPIDSQSWTAENRSRSNGSGASGQGQFADPAKVRILQAAESLFADATIESVSFREIAQSADHSNTNAVQYHFGTREALVQAIFAWRVTQLAPLRAAGLAKAEAAGKLCDLPTLMRILCLPYTDLKDDRGRHTYAGFMSQYLLRHRPAGLQHPADTQDLRANDIRRLNDHIYDCIGVTSHIDGDFRLALALLVFCNTLVLADNEVAPREDSAVFAKYVETGLTMATAALQAGIGISFAGSR